MAAPSVTYILTNGTAADATQINTNFNDIINGFSDGTKDFIMASGDLSGNLVVDGNTTLGDASGDTLTVNATASFANNVTLGATADDTLTVNATASFANNVTLGSTSDDTLTVNATASFANNVTLGATADDDITMNGVVGKNILMADGKGIDFSRFKDNSVAGTTIKEILSDYELGSWTPNDASGANLTFTGTFGRYIKIGDLVWINMWLNYPQTTNQNMAMIGGLPYIPSGYSSLTMFLGTFPNQSNNETVFVNTYRRLELSRTNANMSQARVEINGFYASIQY